MWHVLDTGLLDTGLLP